MSLKESETKAPLGVLGSVSGSAAFEPRAVFCTRRPSLASAYFSGRPGIDCGYRCDRHSLDVGTEWAEENSGRSTGLF